MFCAGRRFSRGLSPSSPKYYFQWSPRKYDRAVVAANISTSRRRAKVLVVPSDHFFGGEKTCKKIPMPHSSGALKNWCPTCLRHKAILLLLTVTFSFFHSFFLFFFSSFFLYTSKYIDYIDYIYNIYSSIYIFFFWNKIISGINDSINIEVVSSICTVYSG